MMLLLLYLYLSYTAIDIPFQPGETAPNKASSWGEVPYKI